MAVGKNWTVYCKISIQKTTDSSEGTSTTENVEIQNTNKKIPLKDDLEHDSDKRSPYEEDGKVLTNGLCVTARINKSCFLSMPF